MNKNNIVLYVIIIILSVAFVASALVLMLSNDTTNDTSSILPQDLSSLDLESAEDYSVPIDVSNVFVNTSVDNIDISQEEAPVLHGWVINNMGYTYFYGDAAYEQFNYKSTALERYVNSVNNLSAKLPEKTKLYNIIAPVSSSFANIPRDIYVSDNFHNASQVTFNSTVASKLDDKVNNVSIVAKLEEEYDNGKYVYFRSDKNWTPLAAYIAYTEFCVSSGIKPYDISEFESFVVDEYLGSFYNSLSYDKNNENSLAFANVFWEKPDKIFGYSPLQTVKTALTIYDAGLVYDNYKLCANSVSEYNGYNVFLGKTAARYEINTNTGGGNLLIIGDESAYPLVSFLASHYGKIDVINPVKYEGDLQAFLSQRDYNDCINICYTTNAVSGEYIPELNKLIGANDE